MLGDVTFFGCLAGVLSRFSGHDLLPPLLPTLRRYSDDTVRACNPHNLAVSYVSVYLMLTTENRKVTGSMPVGATIRKTPAAAGVFRF
ncbi:hypothetical protein Jden_2335 [Jonesia denitrificans DSM 20603]|uniref:Uncharacterized protein n=1 Tax=Jonesia denitrificans (strain ATCC 14870 / DSM 20603 / BCRC 15368 / CIP 55.134 / JCM 11481 / NBRC 15587 / NCTC 10816 / Prevot 55134) TaxID=471856 RepID=C7R282_JONDD|nr:hypothetical protein Jden_2335 [Jonesia denitrificans DSM 20603]